ncbi:hypothetical protein GKE82_24730 [Conexibacter sp. W3-3-2]|uniref:hypothetical protein n=1 Tax=Conexibacter sp. W3-3-2 TaxID=2675227 RepID=UPI0012B9F093|nr:hypothetical protein [Conexibacter sp. W3-3-2]MTD47146.1 hypothetical protein [Conexibacter sp. W3-3-2]MTD47414.1 hypothetical protein [Conexibacter sp. W3-3-2]
MAHRHTPQPPDHPRPAPRAHATTAARGLWTLATLALGVLLIASPQTLTGPVSKLWNGRDGDGGISGMLAQRSLLELGLTAVGVIVVLVCLQTLLQRPRPPR